MTTRLESLRVQAEMDASQYLNEAQKVTQANEAMAASAGKTATTLDQQNVRVSQSATAVDRLARSIDPAFRSQQAYERGLTTLTRAVETGRVSQERYTDLLGKLRDKYQPVTTATTGLGIASRFTYTQLEILRAGVTNTAQSFAAGMDPMRTLLTQFAQTAPAFAGMAAGMGMLIGVSAGVVAAVGGVIAANYAYKASINAVADANRLMGGVAGLTGAQLETLARNAASNAGISIKAAREQEAAYLATGKIGSGVMTSLIENSRAWAKVTGQSSDEVIKQLSKAFSDPAKGAAALSDAYNLLDASELHRIQTLAEQGHRTEAQNELLRTMEIRLAAATDKVRDQASAWERLWHFVSNTFDALGKATAPETTDDALRRLTKARADLMAAQGINERQFAQETGGKNIPKSWVPIDERYNIPEAGVVRGARLEQLDAQIADLRERQRQENLLAVQRADAARQRQQSNAAKDALFSTDPYLGKIDKLSASREQLTAGQGLTLASVPGSEKIAQNISRIDAEYADLKRVEAAGLTLDAYKGRLSAEAQAKAATISNPQDRAVYLAQRRTEIQLIGTATTALERETAVRTAVQSVTAAQRQALTDLTTQQKLQVDAQNRLAAAAGQGEAAMRRANIENQVAAAASKGAAEATIVRASAEAQEAAKVREIRVQAVADLTNQAVAQERMAAAAAKGPAAIKEVDLSIQAQNLALKEGVKGTEAYNQAYGQYLALLQRGADAQGAQQLQAMIAQQEQQLQVGQQQLDLLMATDAERAVETARLQANIDLKRQGLDVDGALAQQYVANAEAIAKQTANYQQQQATVAELQNFATSAFDKIGTAITQAFATGQQTAVKWGNVVKAVISELIQEVIKLAALNPLKNWALGGPARPTLGSIGGLSGFFPSSSGSAGASGGSNSVGVSDIFSLGRSISGSSGSGLTSWLDGVGASIGFAPTVGTITSAGNIGAFTSEAALQGSGLASGGALGGATFSSFLGGAGAGFAAGTILNSLIGGNQVGGTVGSGLGAAAGAIIGSIIPGLGTLLGGLTGGAGGGLIGGMFGAGKSVGPNGSATIQLVNGQFMLNASGADNGGSAQPYIDAVNTTSKALNTLTANYNVQAKAGVVTAAGMPGALGTGGYGTFGVDSGIGPTAKSAADLFANIIRAGGLTSSDPNIALALKNTTASDPAKVEADIQFAQSFTAAIDAMKQSTLDFTSTIDGQAAAQMADATKQIKDFKAKTAELGLDTNAAADATRQYVELLVGIRQAAPAETFSQTAVAWQALIAKFKNIGPLLDEVGIGAYRAAGLLVQAKAQFVEGFNQGVTDQITAILDPLKAQLDAEKKIADQRLADAKLIGGDIVQVERLNALERQKIIEQSAQSSLDNIRSLIQEYTTGSSSPLTGAAKVGLAQSAYIDTANAASNGDLLAKDRFAAVAKDYLTAASEAFATSPAFAAIYRQVLGKAGQLAGVPIPQFAAGGIASGLAIVGENGAELVQFNQPSRVIDAGRTSRILQAANDSGPVVAAIGQAAAISSEDSQMLRRQVNALMEEVAALRQEVRRQNNQPIRKV